MKVRKIGLIMRKGYGIHADHIETLGRLADEIHLWTNDPTAQADPRFTAAYPVASSEEEAARTIVEQARQAGVSRLITWQETDIVLSARVNELLGNTDLPLSAAEISRDKAKQRTFLKSHGIPSPEYHGVGTVEEAKAAAEKIGYPVILKPTRAASSKNVSLVHSDAELAAAFADLQKLVESGAGLYYQEGFDSVALVEEFLPNDECTLDGVVLDGVFYLGGINNKARMMGPYFEEDEYTMPYIGDAEERMRDIAERIYKGLEVKNSLVNVEIRQDKNGDYKVVEFSTRISGGHVYRNVRDVYGVDLVAAHALQLMEETETAKFFTRRAPSPKASTCIKFVYRTGKVMANTAGEAATAPEFRAYYPTAKPGEVVASAPVGFDIAGLLSIRGSYKEPADVERLKEKARQLDQQLNLQVVNVDGDE